IFRVIDCFEDSEPCVSRRTFSQLYNPLARTLPESEFLSALRSHASSCRAPAVKREPNLERCQYYDPFPCQRTNANDWINADLGTRVYMQPARWRIWQKANSPQPHRSMMQ